MCKRTGSILFVICVVMVFTAQTYRLDNKEQKNVPAARGAFAARPAIVSHNNQSRPQVQSKPQAQSRPQVPTRREAPGQVVNRRRTVQSYSQPVGQEREAPRVYAVHAPEPVVNNRLLGRKHSNHWQPRYNFYNNQYHFYPYVNITAVVELSGGYFVLGPDGQNYYYDQGTFYLQEAGQFVAVAPPIGIIVNPLAAGARQLIVNNQVFYRYKGIFYVQVAQGYQVVGPVQYISDGT